MRITVGDSRDIAMGLGGTEVTRQAADIILSDDNFSTIVSSVGEGRRIYDNIVKFLVYLLTCNGAEVWVMLFAVILDMPVPFLSLMLLWANIFGQYMRLVEDCQCLPCGANRLCD
jgi:Ca2+-transporting ATPase